MSFVYLLLLCLILMGMDIHIMHFVTTYRYIYLYIPIDVEVRVRVVQGHQPFLHIYTRRRTAVRMGYIGNTAAYMRTVGIITIVVI